MDMVSGKVRDRMDRSWSVGWASVPAVPGPGFGYEVSNDDDRIGKGEGYVDHVAADCGLRTSVQIANFLNPRSCQELMRSMTHLAPTCSGIPCALITPSQPRVPNRFQVLP